MRTSFYCQPYYAVPFTHLFWPVAKWLGKRLQHTNMKHLRCDLLTADRNVTAQSSSHGFE